MNACACLSYAAALIASRRVLMTKGLPTVAMPNVSACMHGPCSPAEWSVGRWTHSSLARQEQLSVEAVLRGRVDALGDPVCEQEVGALRLRVRHLRGDSSSYFSPCWDSSAFQDGIEMQHTLRRAGGVWRTVVREMCAPCGRRRGRWPA